MGQRSDVRRVIVPESANDAKDGGNLDACVDGREQLLISLAMAGVGYAVISGLFEYPLEMRWPAGLFFGNRSCPMNLGCRGARSWRDAIAQVLRCDCAH